MNIDQMRKEIRDQYGGYRWKEKVDKMKDAQVLAIYRRMQKDDKVK